MSRVLYKSSLNSALQISSGGLHGFGMCLHSPVIVSSFVEEPSNLVVASSSLAVRKAEYGTVKFHTLGVQDECFIEVASLYIDIPLGPQSPGRSCRYVRSVIEKSRSARECTYKPNLRPVSSSFGLIIAIQSSSASAALSSSPTSNNERPIFI